MLNKKGDQSRIILIGYCETHKCKYMNDIIHQKKCIKTPKCGIFHKFLQLAKVVI